MRLPIWLLMGALLSGPGVLPAGEVSAEPEGADLLRWFSEWTDEVEIRALSAQFSVRRQADVAGTPEKKGSWHARVVPSFAQKLEFWNLVEGGKALYEAHSWDLASGEGRSYRRPARTLRGEGTLIPGPPKPLGTVDLPSDLYFLMPRGRTVKAFAAACELEVRTLDNGYLAAYLSMGKKLKVYVLDRSERQPVREMRTYMSKLPPVPVRNKFVGDPIDLPARFQGAHLFANKVVSKSALVEGVPIPVEWEVRHSLRDPDWISVVSLDVPSIRLNEAVDGESLSVKWPPGTKVHDSVKVDTFFVGVDEEEKWSELISEMSLATILEMAGVRLDGIDDPERVNPSPEATGCGANVLYLVCALLGEPQRLRALVEDLGITEENPFSTVADLVRVAESAGVPALAVEGGPDLLRGESSAPLVLHVERKDRQGTTHFVVVDHYDVATGTLRVLDPPMLPYRSGVDDVCRSWSGKAVVFGQAGVEDLGAVAGSHAAQMWLVSAAVVLCIGGVFVAARRRRCRAS